MQQKTSLEKFVKAWAISHKFKNLCISEMTSKDEN